MADATLIVVKVNARHCRILLCEVVRELKGAKSLRSMLLDSTPTSDIGGNAYVNMGAIEISTPHFLARGIITPWTGGECGFKLCI